MGFVEGDLSLHQQEHLRTQQPDAFCPVFFEHFQLFQKLDDGANGDASFYEAKIATARFFMAKILPENSALFAKIMAGSESLMSFEDAAF